MTIMEKARNILAFYEKSGCAIIAASNGCYEWSYEGDEYGMLFPDEGDKYIKGDMKYYVPDNEIRTSRDEIFSGVWGVGRNGRPWIMAWHPNILD